MTGNPESAFAASRMGIRASARNCRISDPVHGPVHRIGEEDAEFMIAILARGAH